MQVDFKVKMNEKLYLKDPESTEIGRLIIKKGMKMISELGYEHFSFKKLALEIGSMEATVYRYFENKHKLLVYLVDYYWAFVEFKVIFQSNNIVSPEEKIKKLIDILLWEDDATHFFCELDQRALHIIMISEGSKTYLSKEGNSGNEDFKYQPYKDLCNRISSLFKEYNPIYKFPAFLASTLIESAHMQHYFMHKLHRMDGCTDKANSKEIKFFLEQLIFGVLNAGKL